jgi:hypothetical protein
MRRVRRLDIVEVPLKEVSKLSRFHEAAGAVMELAHQIVGPRTFLVSHIDTKDLSILRVFNAGTLHVTEGVYALEDTY